MGYVSGNAAYAYPINILNFHELVNGEIDGIPVLVSYRPLCVSGVVYKRELNSQVLLFGNTSALYQSDLVMYRPSVWFLLVSGRWRGGSGELTSAHWTYCPQPRWLERNGKHCTPTPNFWSARQTHQLSSAAEATVRISRQVSKKGLGESNSCSGWALTCWTGV